MRSSLVFISVLVLGAAAVSIAVAPPPAGSQRAGSTSDQPMQLIETAELMELLFVPAYNDLTRVIATKPANRVGFRAIYDAAFRMAELHNLLFFRTGKPFMGRPDWAGRVAAARKLSADVAEAVMKTDYDLARKRYEAVAEACNSCHKQYEVSDAPQVKSHVPVEKK